MPICFSGDSSGHPLLEYAKLAHGEPVEFRGYSANCLDIGLVNNMPDKALLSTERQFLTLLDSAAHDVVVRLWLYALPDIPRNEWGQRHIGNFYSGPRASVRSAPGRPHRDRRGAAIAKLEGRTILVEPDQGHRVGGAEYLLRRLVLPGRPCCCFALRRHRTPPPPREMLRPFRVQARCGASVDGRHFATFRDAPFPLERYL